MDRTTELLVSAADAFLADLLRQGKDGPAYVITAQRVSGTDHGAHVSATFDIVAALRSVIAAFDAAGFQIVPKEPTKEMVSAGEAITVEPNEGRWEQEIGFFAAQAVYRAMLAAAPNA